MQHQAISIARPSRYIIDGHGHIRNVIEKVKVEAGQTRTRTYNFRYRIGRNYIDKRKTFGFFDMETLELKAKSI